jgi:pyruvate dehydrogenase phosphatase
MPTRSFGDFTLKHEEFNNPKDLDSDMGLTNSFFSFINDPLSYRQKFAHFNGPYITHQPEIRVIELKPEDRYLILSSDGMWDELKKNDVVEVVKGNVNEKNKITQA